MIPAQRLQKVETRILSRSRENLFSVQEDPVTFARSIGFNPDPWQEGILLGRGKRVLLNCCRQSGKSSTTAIVALHTALAGPESLILLVSPSLRQSSELFGKVIAFLNRLAARPRMVEENRLSIRFMNGSRIVSLPGKEGTIRGFSGAALIVEDEAARVPDALYRAVRPMLAVSSGSLMLLSTPFGKRGHFFEEWTHGGTAWERVQVAATQCPRIPGKFLEEEKKALGPWWYGQEYECQFSDTESSVFSYDLIQSAISPDVAALEISKENVINVEKIHQHDTTEFIRPNSRNGYRFA